MKYYFNQIDGEWLFSLDGKTDYKVVPYLIIYNISKLYPSSIKDGTGYIDIRKDIDVPEVGLISTYLSIWIKDALIQNVDLHSAIGGGGIIKKRLKTFSIEIIQSE